MIPDAGPSRAAVQRARETARRAQCAANPHQIGVAFSHRVSRSGGTPGGLAGLPRQHQRTQLADLPCVATAAGQTTRATTPSVFLCPSDPGPPGPGAGGGANDAGDGGVGSAPTGRVRNGAFDASINDFADGLSNTAAVSEWLRGGGSPRVRDPKRAIFATRDRSIGPTDLDRFGSECHGPDPRLAQVAPLGKGMDRTRDGFGFTPYNHVPGINDHTCTDGGLVDQGAWTAGSAHPSGANVLSADGHVTVLKDSIALNAWRAPGTRNGGEVVSGDTPSSRALRVRPGRPSEPAERARWHEPGADRRRWTRTSPLNRSSRACWTITTRSRASMARTHTRVPIRKRNRRGRGRSAPAEATAAVASFGRGLSAV